MIEFLDKVEASHLKVDHWPDGVPKRLQNVANAGKWVKSIRTAFNKFQHEHSQLPLLEQIYYTLNSLYIFTTTALNVFAWKFSTR